ncbi:hypothetical protein CAP35_04755 [Chitinophagaceae bacterium IBVUCB1]|nr:hypothetical protein CAP35_04755 [Chitinophagaceae bacterium IBVUCB1]
MAEKQYAYTSFGEILSRIHNPTILKEMLARAKEIEAEKDNYWQNYYVQYDNYKLHNRKFGGNSKGITPMEFDKQMDRLLLHEGNQALREQDEIEQRKGETKSEKQNLSPENKQPSASNDNKSDRNDKETYVSADDFQKLIDELAARKNVRHNKWATKSAEYNKEADKDIDPRRLEFRQQLKEIYEKNARDKDKEKGLN